MTAPADDQFNQIIKGFDVTSTAPEHIDPTPYGPTTTVPAGPAVKPGLTTRGKAALGISAAVIAGGSLLGYQAYSANAAEADLKAHELALKADALELEKLKVLNQTKKADETTATQQATARQTAVDTCVNSLKNQVGKGYGSPRYGEIVEDCQSQYPASPETPDMQSAAASQDLDTSTGSDDGGGVNSGILLGLGALGAIAIFGAKKGTRTVPAA